PSAGYGPHGEVEFQSCFVAAESEVGFSLASRGHSSGARPERIARRTCCMTLSRASRPMPAVEIGGWTVRRITPGRKATSPLRIILFAPETEIGTMGAPALSAITKTPFLNG